MSNSKRKHGTGNIMKRGKYYYFRYMINGKAKLISLKTTIRKEAEKIVQRDYLPVIQARSLEGIALHVKEAKSNITQKKIDINDGWEVYYGSHKRPDSSESTLNGYKFMYRKFIDWLASNNPEIKYTASLNEDIAEAYAKYLWQERKVSERTFNAYIKGLDLIFRIINGKSHFNRDVITRKNENQQGHKKFTQKQIGSIFAAFDDEELKLMHKLEMKVLFHIGAMSGLRLIDACLLKWENISFEDKLIRCIPCKTSRTAKKRQAVIPIPNELEQALQEALQWKKENEDYVLPNVAERYQRNKDGIGSDVAKVLRFAGMTTQEEIKGLQRIKKINRYGFHSFRHYYASKMATSGYDINMLAKILADDVRTLQIYYINIDDHAVRQEFARKTQNTDHKSQIDELLASASEKQLEEIHSMIKDYF